MLPDALAQEHGLVLQRAALRYQAKFHRIGHYELINRAWKARPAQ
jgi:hypothetical protein